MNISVIIPMYWQVKFILCILKKIQLLFCVHLATTHHLLYQSLMEVWVLCANKTNHLLSYNKEILAGEVVDKDNTIFIFQRKMKNAIYKKLNNKNIHNPIGITTHG